MRDFILSSPTYLLFCVLILAFGLISGEFLGKFPMLICLELACLRFYASNKIFLTTCLLGLNLILMGTSLDTTNEITASFTASENLTKFSVLNLLILLGVISKIFALSFISKKYLNFALTILICSYLFIFTCKFTNLQGNLLFSSNIKYLLLICLLYLSIRSVFAENTTNFGSNFILINFCSGLLIILNSPNNFIIAILYFLTNAVLIWGLSFISLEEEKKEKNEQLPKSILIAEVVIYLSMIGLLPNLNLFAKSSFNLTTLAIIISQATAFVPLIKVIKKLWQKT